MPRDRVEQWQERLDRVPASIIADGVTAEKLAERYDVSDPGLIDDLTRDAGQRARPDEPVNVLHFDQAAEAADVAIDTDGSIEADGGPASAERVDELEERVAQLQDEVTNLQARVEHVDGKVNRVLTGARAFADALDGAGGDRDV